MKVYVQTDIEGVAGFCFYENRAAKDPEAVAHRQRMYRLLTGEVDAAVRAAFDAGATDVLVNDNHGSGYNILFEDLDPRCRIIHGRNCSGPHWLPLLDSGVDALVLVGMHAMGGTPVALLSHSLWRVNDGALELGEGSMAAAIAGDFAVPTVFASGDDWVTAELKEKIPALEACRVKEALSPYQACSLVPARARERIYEGVRAGLARRDAVPPYRVPGPVRLELWDSAGHVPPLARVGEAVEAPTINEAFMRYEDAMPWTHFRLRDPDGFVYP